MEYIISISSQGKMTIPAQLRKKLGLYKKSKANLWVKEGEIFIKPLKEKLKKLS